MAVRDARLRLEEETDMGSTIAVLGSANMDLVVRLERRPEPGETVFGTQFTKGPGGKGLNQACAAARAGAHVRMLAAVGQDEFGTELIERMSAEGIDVDGVVRRPGSTGTAHITVTADGENSIVVVSGANASDELSDDARAAIAASSHLVVQFERPLPLLREALSFAREHGVTTVLTPAPADAAGASLIELADVLVPNEGEARLLTGCPDAESAAIALSRLAGTVIVTLGSRGAIIARNGAIIERIASKRVTPVDTTAAGDTFVGVLVAGLAEGVDLVEALETATVAAAITVTRHGAVDAMPTRDEIRAGVR